MTNELEPLDIWDDATNAVCQSMQENKMCNCPDGDCLASKIEPSEETMRHWNTRASPSVDSHLCNTKDVECQKIQNLEHKTELENIIQDAVNKTLAQPKYRRGQYIIEDSELQKYATPSADTLAGLVRYEPNRKSYPWFEMEKDEQGEYVLHSQAAEIIAAKDRIAEKQISELVERMQDDVAHWKQRAEAAEGKLAQYEDHMGEDS